MLAGQRELRRRVVIELRSRPLRRRMAALAGCREPGGLMVRIDGLVEVRQVAARAVLRRAGELAVDVARGALHRRMLAGQRELRRRVVIELRSRPLRRRMAALAGCREPGGLMVRIDGLVEVRQVAGRAVLRRARELAVDVALAHCTAVCLPVSGNFVAVL